MPDKTLHEYLEVAIAAAQDAGALIRDRWWSKRRVERKSDASLVTAIDRDCEARIREILGTETPKCLMLGEEEGTGGRAWPEWDDEKLWWYVDPVDGTTNLAHRFPWIAVSIALMRAGRPQVAVVYNPVQELLFAASAGGGATLNESPIRVSPCAELGEALVATGFLPSASLPRKERNLRHFRSVIGKCYGVRRAGAASLDLAAVAAGWLDAYWELDLKPWDTAAGWLLVEEAGGLVTRLNGEAFDPHVPEVLASTPAVHPEMMEALCAAE